MRQEAIKERQNALVYSYNSAYSYCHLFIVYLCSIYFLYFILLGSKASSSKQGKPLDNIKKEFINKLQNKNPMLSLDNSMDSLDTLGPDVPMLDPELMSKRKIENL